MTSPRLAFWTIGGLTVVAVVLRTISLNSELWYDEILTLVEYVRRPLPEIVSRYSRSNHVLYSVLAHASIDVFGEHPWTLRLPAMVFGVACVPALYVLGTAVGSRREALLAAGLLTVSYHHIWFSQDARGYTALGFWTLASTIFLVRGLRDDGRGWYVTYGCAAALGLYTHVTMGFVIVAQWLASMGSLVAAEPGRVGPKMRRSATGFGLAGVISVLLYAPVLAQMHLSWERSPSDPQVKAATLSFAARDALQSLDAGLGTWVALFGFLLLAVGCWSYFNQDRLVLALMILPGLLTMLGILVLGAPVRPRFFLMLIGFGLLLAVRGAMVTGTWVSRPWRRGNIPYLDPSMVGVAFVGVGMLASVSSLGYLYRYPKQDFTGALDFVEKARAPEDTVATASVAAIPYRDYYGRDWPGVKSADQLEALRPSSGRVWLIYSLPEYLKPGLAHTIRRECPPVRVFHGTLGGGDVVVCALR